MAWKGEDEEGKEGSAPVPSKAMLLLILLLMLLLIALLLIALLIALLFIPPLAP